MLALVAQQLGCAPLPRDEFDRAARRAGIEEPIRFDTSGMRTDVANATEARRLTVDDAVRRTLKNDAGVQAALARVRIALADARQARLLPNPVVSVALRFPESGGGKPVIEAGLAADLISVLTKPRQISAADQRLRAASSEALGIVLDALADVQERYANVQALDAQVETIKERQRLLARLLELARARLQAGETSRLDVITLQTERASLEVELTQTMLERREQRLALARLIGEPSAGAEWALAAWSPPAVAPVSESRWIETALERRPEIQAYWWAMAALGDDVAIARLGMLEGSGAGVDAEREDAWTVGPAVTVPIPLLDWGQARRAKLHAQQMEVRHQLTQKRREVVEEVRRAIEVLRATQRGVELVRRELVPLSDQRREQAEASYKNGFADITAVLLAEQEAQQARAKLIELEQKVSVAQVRLERAAGGPGAVRAATRPTTRTATERR
ncbi:MAG TPA: TolC family protein [Tepidisphaeraceae bacterium]|jgi:outer membrane protein TolC